MIRTALNLFVHCRGVGGGKFSLCANGKYATGKDRLVDRENSRLRRPLRNFCHHNVATDATMVYATPCCVVGPSARVL